MTRTRTPRRFSAGAVTVAATVSLAALIAWGSAAAFAADGGVRAPPAVPHPVAPAATPLTSSESSDAPQPAVIVSSGPDGRAD
jgi:hypothetical protein